MNKIEKYRKDDQYYIDSYDRQTIRTLKKLEQEALEKGEELITRLDSMKHLIMVEDQWRPDTMFYEEAVSRAQSKDTVIRQLMWDDEQRDRLVERYRTPEGIKCNACNTRMFLNTHFFRENNTAILFVFKCPKGHAPQKVVYPNGDEYYIAKKKCSDCGGELETTTDRTKTKIICTDKCTDCGKVFVDEFDLGFPSDTPIDEAERKKYCTDFRNSKTLAQSIIELGKLAEKINAAKSEREIKEEYKIDEIEKPTIPLAEIRLSKLTEELGYVKFQFGKPEMGKHIIVEFSVQDPSDRTERESELLLKKSITENLFPTCWRLMSQGVSYRMGYITGKLKAYTDDEGLLKIGKEIKESKKGTK